MPITRDEAFSKSRSIKSKVQEIDSKMTSALNALGDVDAILSTINNRISKSVQANDIINQCNNRINNNIIKSIGKVQDDVSNLRKVAVSDANKYISAIESSYNNSLKEGETPIHLERISTSTGTSKKSTTKTGTTKSSSSSSNTSKRSNKTNSTQNTNLIDNINDQMNRFLNINLSNEINTADISSWTNYINEFLVVNKLNNYISNIRAENHQIYFTLFNGQEYSLSNVTTADELIESIKKVINNM